MTHTTFRQLPRVLRAAALTICGAAPLVIAAIAETAPPTNEHDGTR